MSGHTVLWDTTLAHYHGPDTYPLSATEFDVAIDGTFFNLAQSATGSILVRPDFSATITFAGVKSNSGGGSVSGSVSWTCADPQ